MDTSGDPCLSSHPKKTPTEDQEGASQSIVPPYWQQHRRFESYSSVGHLQPTPIRLHDNTAERSEGTSPLWAKTVAINDYVLITGNLPSFGDYVVWNCHIEMLDVSLQLDFLLSQSRS